MIPTVQMTIKVTLLDLYDTAKHWWKWPLCTGMVHIHLLIRKIRYVYVSAHRLCKWQNLCSSQHIAFLLWKHKQIECVFVATLIPLPLINSSVPKHKCRMLKLPYIKIVTVRNTDRQCRSDSCVSSCLRWWQIKTTPRTSIPTLHVLSEVSLRLRVYYVREHTSRHVSTT